MTRVYLCVRVCFYRGARDLGVYSVIFLYTRVRRGVTSRDSSRGDRLRMFRACSESVRCDLAAGPSGVVFAVKRESELPESPLFLRTCALETVKNETNKKVPQIFRIGDTVVAPPASPFN